MARTATFIYPPPHQATASWNQLEDSTLGHTLSTDAQDIVLCSLTEDDSELIMMPVLRHYPEDIGEIDDWRVCEDGAPYKCWKTTAIYLKIGRDHPRLVRFLRPDPLKWMPVLANPGGPNLQEFIDANRFELYDQRNNEPSDKSTACARIKTSCLNLVYQWSLHLASALEFLHSHSFVEPAPHVSVIFGDLRVSSCWLDPSGTSLSVLGFLHATFRARDPAQYSVGNLGHGGFQPLSRNCEPTLQTDVFLWGCVVYELMTGYWPGEGQGLEWEDVKSLVPRQEWPGLETVYLGDVVRGCWTGEIISAAELLRAVRRAITELGVEFDEHDGIGGLSLDGDSIAISKCGTRPETSYAFIEEVASKDCSGTHASYTTC